MRNENPLLAERLIAYGAAVGAASTAASGDIVVVEGTGIPLD